MAVKKGKAKPREFTEEFMNQVNLWFEGLEPGRLVDLQVLKERFNLTENDAQELLDIIGDALEPLDREADKDARRCL